MNFLTNFFTPIFPHLFLSFFISKKHVICICEKFKFTGTKQRSTNWIIDYELFRINSKIYFLKKMIIIATTLNF